MYIVVSDFGFGWSVRPVFAIFFLMMMFANISISQTSFSILFNKKNSDEACPKIIVDKYNTTYAIVSKASIVDTLNPYIHDCSLYKIWSDGDTLAWHHGKIDTVIQFNDIAYTANNNLVLIGNGWEITNYNYNSSFQCIYYLDTNLNVIWHRTYRLHYNYISPEFTSFLKTKDSKFLYVSSSRPDTCGSYYSYAFCFNSEGDSVFYKFLHKTVSSSSFFSITYNPDSTEYWFHIKKGDSPGQSSIKRIVFDLDLNEISAHYYPDQDFMSPFSSMQYDNGYLVGGRNLVTSDERYIRAYIFNNNFNPTDVIDLTDPSQDIPNYPAWFNCIDYYYPNRIFIGGMCQYQGGFFNPNPSWLYIACLDNNLELLYEEYFGGDAYYNMYDIKATPDGGVVICGDKYIDSIQDNERDGYVLKYDSLVFVGEKEIKLKSDRSYIVTYPNPGKDRVFFKNIELGSLINIYSYDSRLIFSNLCHSETICINTSFLQPGVYIYQIINNNVISKSGKWIKSN